MSKTESISYLNREVVMSPYDSNWPLMFEAEKNKILSVIGDKGAVVEHVGSTAVPGLAAKPIIDILIGTKDLATANTCIKLLENVGYEYVPALEKHFPYRRYLHKGPNLPNKHFHLHMVEIDSVFWQRQIKFRDYLRGNPDATLAYQNLKEILSERFKNDVSQYCEAKSDFINDILAKCAFSRNE